MNSDRLGIGVIGAGRVGPVLANALRAAGHAIVGIHVRSQASRERAEAMLPGVPLLEIDQVVERSNLVLVTVSDDALGPLIGQLAERGAWLSGQLLVHTAGRFGIGIAEPAARLGAIPLAIHPAMTFGGTSLDVARLSGCAFAVTAGAGMLPLAQALVTEMGGIPIAVPESSRTLYHAALSHGANHLVTLVDQAATMLRAAGVDQVEAVLGPLLRASLEGALATGPAALTGPVARADVGTVSAHVAALRALSAAADDDQTRSDGPAADPTSRLASDYCTLARATTVLARAQGRITSEQATQLWTWLRPEGQE